MDWILDLQRRIGEPVVGFAQQYWLPLLILVLLTVWFVFFHDPDAPRRDTAEDGVELDADGDD